MRLPRNGKVIVIDNEPKEAAPLLKTLSKNCIPHTYYTGELEYLPKEGDMHDDVRIVFLDINLAHNIHGVEAILGQLSSTLKRV